MSDDLNKTPSANRVHIGFFGMRNAGKSSLVNAVTNQALSIVSDVAGTTTDPVSKAMEILPLGPVVIIDTPGLDDEGALGEMRVKKAYSALNRCDLAVLVIDAQKGKQDADKALISKLKAKDIPFITVYNKADKVSERGDSHFYVSAETGENVNELKEKIAELGSRSFTEKPIIADKLSPFDTVILVTPIDSSAPRGRMILPQVQTIRDTLNANAACVVTQTEQLSSVLSSLKSPPKLVITDSQAFETVKDIVPESVFLTSFSILMARYKGFLETAALGAARISALKDNDLCLISEGCTHHRQCKDIGSVKLPSWLKSYTEKDLRFEYTSGTGFPDDLSPYSLIIHCGGCMLNERELNFRRKCAEDAGIPFTNYGTAIAYMNGILKRSLQIFPELYARL